MWVLPSRGRPDRLQSALNSMIETGLSTEGLVLVNQDDLSDYESVKLPPKWALNRLRASSAADCYRWVYQTQKFDWVGILSDDILPKTQGWDVKLIEARGKGFSSCNDLRKAPRRVGPAMVFDAGLIKAMGFIVPDGFHHAYVDDVWEGIGRDFGIWTCLMDVVVEHLHPFFGKAPKDSTYDHAYSQMSMDKERFEQWKMNEKLEVYRRIKEML